MTVATPPMTADAIDRLIDAERDRCRHVVVACMPKSASTFLCSLLAEATGYRPYLLNTLGHDTERTIDRLSIPTFLRRDTVSQEHMRATRENVRLLARMGVRPVVLVRDLMDVIVSACDHSEQVAGSGPAAHLPSDFDRWSREDRLWLVVRMGTPWFLNLVTSWIDAASRLDTLWITYDDVVGDTAATVRRALEHAGVVSDEGRIDAAIAGVDPSTTRLNRGVSGRGRAELSAPQQAAVREIADVYRGAYDLSIIGL